MRCSLFFSALCFLLPQFLVSAPATAQEARPTDDGILGLTLQGFVSTALNYNLSYSGRQVDASVRGFDNEYGSFQLDLAQVVVARKAEELGDFGARIDVGLGTSIPKRSPSPGFAAGDIELLQAYATYIFAIGSGLRLDVGKFVTHMGAEVVEGVDGYNDHYSRSILFANAIPVDHTGVRLSYDISPSIGFMLTVSNGADLAIDTNDFKSIGTQLKFTGEVIEFYLNNMFGPENAGDNRTLRIYTDVVLVAKPTRGLSITANFDLTIDSNNADTPGDDGKTVLGFALATAYAVNDSFKLALRGEFFDPDTDLTYIEFTLTPTFTPHKNFAIRPEFRLDLASDETVWVVGSNKARKIQFTTALNFVGFF